ncbi:MerR family DNA-binding transcriptional regulator [Myxococcus sp. 1LA]
MPNCPRPTAGPAVHWLSIKEAAHRTGISPRTLNRWAQLGLIEADRMASGHGQWLIAINERGNPISTTPFVPGAAVAAPTAVSATA